MTIEPKQVKVMWDIIVLGSSSLASGVLSLSVLLGGLPLCFMSDLPWTHCAAILTLTVLLTASFALASYAGFVRIKLVRHLWRTRIVIENEEVAITTSDGVVKVRFLKNTEMLMRHDGIMISGVTHNRTIKVLLPRWAFDNAEFETMTVLYESSRPSESNTELKSDNKDSDTKEGGK